MSAYNNKNLIKHILSLTGVASASVLLSFPALALMSSNSTIVERPVDNTTRRANSNLGSKDLLAQTTPGTGQGNPGTITPTPIQVNPGTITPTPIQVNPGRINQTPGQVYPGGINQTPGQVNPGGINQTPEQVNPVVSTKYLDK